MAKGQLSDKDLEQGIQSLGGLTGFATAVSRRRDSPFGSEFARKAEPKADVQLEKVVEVALPDIVQPVSQGPTDIPESGISLKPDVMTEAPKKPKTPKLLVHPKTEKEKGEGEPSTGFEAVTVKMTSAMRDDLNFLATKLQRRRKTKEERITTNTVIRVAAQLLLDELKLNEADFANNEEELLALTRRKLIRK